MASSPPVSVTDVAEPLGVTSPLVTAPATEIVSPRPTRWQQWCCDQLLQAFSAFTQGELTLVLPDGTEHQFGQPTDNVAPALMKVHQWRLFSRIMLYGHIGAGESYVEAEWDSPQLQRVVAWFLLNQSKTPFFEDAKARQWFSNALGWINKLQHRRQPNSLGNSQNNIARHYDLGNDFFRLLLDSSMTYSSALFSHPEQSLTDAQIDKYESLCRQLRLQADDEVLEIGSGWGGFACYAARKYGCRITSLTLSTQQLAYATQWAEHLGLSDRVSFQLLDYRKATGQYDKIVSIEMIEAVGDAYYETYFAQCQRLLKPHGLLAIQAIVCPDSRYDTIRRSTDFIQKHIFPGSLIPSLGRLNQATARATQLSVISVLDMGLSYAETLQRWDHHLRQHKAAILALGDGQRYSMAFIRQWHYYLMYCKAAFATRYLSVAQILYSAPGNPRLSPPLETIL